MKLKSKISAIFVVSLMLAGLNLQAQGLFDDKPATTNNDNIVANSNSNKLLRADDNESWGGGAGEPGDREYMDPEGKDKYEPIGEGIFILSLLAGGYTLIKRNARYKNED